MKLTILLIGLLVLSGCARTSPEVRDYEQEAEDNINEMEEKGLLSEEDADEVREKFRINQTEDINFSDNITFISDTNFSAGIFFMETPNWTCKCTELGAIQFCYTEEQWEKYEDDEFIKDYIKYDCEDERQ